MDKESINRPFADLPEFVTEHKISLKVSEEPSPQAEGKRGDDKSLLTEAMQGVKAIRGYKERVMVKRDVQRRKKTADSVGPLKMLEEAIQQDRDLNVMNLPEYMEGYAEGIHPLTMEKLRKGEFSVQKTLDLHGYSIDSAGELFQTFMRDTIREGLHCVKVIHGRGLKSKEVPVLKQSLKTWIIKAMHRKWVIAFSNATMNDGGPGATNILLQKKPIKKRIRIFG